MNTDSHLLVFHARRWWVVRRFDYGPGVGDGWGDPETTGLVCLVGEELALSELPATPVDGRYATEEIDGD